MKRTLQGLSVLLLLAVLFFGYRWLFPGDEAEIRDIIRRASTAASVTRDEGQLGRLTKAAELASICTEDVQVKVDAVGLRGGLDGRDQVRTAGLQLGATFGTYRILPANIEFRDRTSNQARVTLTARFEGAAPADIDAQEFSITFRKHQNRWLIARVETMHLLKR